MATEELSIDELARLAGSNVRNVRLYQERGLLPPPRRDGRTNRYSGEHLDRMKLILELLSRGYPLAAIKELLDALHDRRSLAELLGFEQAVGVPFVTEAPRRYTEEELLQRFPDEGPADSLWRRAVELGLLVPASNGDGWMAPSPSLLEAGAELVADGVPVGAALDVAAVVRTSTDKMADAFVSMFVRHIWEPFLAAGLPADRINHITDALERQRPLAEQAVAAAMALAMQRRVEQVAKEHAEELGGKRGGGRAGTRAGSRAGSRKRRRRGGG
jgi:DNA-binding transcriptional MerR regulator